MKTTIAGILIRNSIEYVHRALTSHAEGRPDEEVRFSIGAQLMIALAIEGIGNEIGEVAFDTWTWKRLEKSDTPLKWKVLSTVIGNSMLDPATEPLQTVQQLSAIRNRIAHPKMLDLGTEIIVRSKDGNLRRNVQLNDTLSDGDFIMLGVGKLLDDYGFNAQSSRDLVQKAIEAIKSIRKELNIEGLEWIDGLEQELSSGLSSA